jgi:hypothetical protein
LVPIRSKADATGEALRANLEATLGLIDAENPARSELLSSTLRPHGSGPDRRPIFERSSDPSYQAFASWVRRVRPARSPLAATPAASPAGARVSEDVFAAGRDRTRGKLGNSEPEPVDAIPAVPSRSSGERGGVMPPMRYREGVGLVPEEEGADPKEFPLPYAVSGVKPGAEGEKAAQGAGRPGGKPALEGKPVAGAKPAVAKKAATPEAASALPVLPDKEEEEELEQAIKALPKNAAKKPAKISPDILMKLLNRGPSS